ncbi:MAG: efflux RND transporter permease subunit [Planctomycetales bacterium]|nr:efflux RND transporter permease subunit [Planctomycetales bacterium]
MPSIVIALAGGIAVRTLLIAQYPEITPPTVEVSESHQASKAYEASPDTGPPAANQTGGPNKKGHARMRPRMALLYWHHRRGSAVSVAVSGFLYSVIHAEVPG